jgi:hypothetical protein
MAGKLSRTYYVRWSFELWAMHPNCHPLSKVGFLSASPSYHVVFMRGRMKKVSVIIVLVTVYLTIMVHGRAHCLYYQAITRARRRCPKDILFYRKSCLPVSGDPFHGYFRYYCSARAALVDVQGATSTSPKEPLQVIIDRWFYFYTTSSNVVATPYLEPDLEADGDSPITPVQRARSLLPIAVWRTGFNNGCTIHLDDPELVVLDQPHSQDQEQHEFLDGQYPTQAIPHEDPTMGGSCYINYRMVDHPIQYLLGGVLPIHPSTRLVTTWGLTLTP